MNALPPSLAEYSPVGLSELTNESKGEAIIFGLHALDGPSLLHDRCLDLSDLRHYLTDFYGPIGRPSIDPELMIRMLIVGYCYGIRSERRLCKEPI